MGKIRILIIRLSSIGDVLLSSPFIRQVRIQFPSARIDFLIKKEFYDLVRYNPHLNKIYLVETKEKFSGLQKLKNKIIANQYQYIFDLHNNLRSRYLTAGLKNSKIFRIDKDIIKRLLLVHFKKNTYDRIIPIPERYLQTAKNLQVQDDKNGLEIFWKDQIDKQAAALLKKENVSQSFIAVAPGAGFQTKRWPTEYFKQLMEMIANKEKSDFVLLGNKKERSEFSELETVPGVHNLAGQLTLLEAAAILCRAKVLISNDSGLMHMATAVKTPVLAIFGSTVKEFGFFPYRGRHMVLENRNLKCRPCSHIGRHSCPKGHFKCMKEIKPETAYHLFRKLV